MKWKWRALNFAHTSTQSLNAAGLQLLRTTIPAARSRSAVTTPVGYDSNGNIKVMTVNEGIPVQQ
jgi:hypothetical protein